MAVLSLSLLGPFAASLEGRALSKFRTNKVQALLIYLAVESEQAHRRDFLMELLWPGLPQPSAQVNLRQTIYRLNQAIPEVTARAGDGTVPLLLSDRQTVQINPDSAYELDVATFTGLLKGEPTPEKLKQATALYRGDFLADFYLPDSNTFEEWAAAWRAGLRRQVLEALDRLTLTHTQQGDYAAAITTAWRQLEIDNLRESAYRQLMVALAHSGQRGEALAQYDICRQLLQAELGIEPSVPTRALYERLVSGEPLLGTSVAAFPPERYRLDREIGRGGMGVVYRAYDTLLDRPVAIKVLSPDALGTEGRTRLLREAQAVAKLSHSNIVPVYDAGEMDGSPFIVMELIEGESLRNAFDLHPPTGKLTDSLLIITRQICAALAHAHAHGIIHRDLKPENVLLTPDGTAKLMDFGLAYSVVAPRLTAEGTIVGTPAYLAPEIALGQAIDGRADLYALGVMLYELTAGRLPFSGNDVLAIISQHLHAPITPPSAYNPEIPPALDELIGQLMSKEPADRPASATVVLQVLDELDRVAERQRDFVSPLYPGTVTTEPPAIPHNLPQQPTPFIGRQAELAALDDLITRPAGRLITIVGAGGMGKTRLALAYAERCLGAPDLFTSGVFFVNLAPLSDVEQIIPTLAQSLHFPLQANDPRSPRQQVLDYLRHKRMLLLLDNFEHLLAGVDLLVEIVQTDPAVRILVTSRERLHLQLEQLYPLQGLAFPETMAAASGIAEEALAYTAVRLFRQSARRNQPDFELHSAGDVADVTRICRLVAGMPLAIELAAAWVDTLSPADIAAEIQQSLDFLETEQRDVPERHRSVRAAIDTSWEKLAEREQATMAQLSVFRGGFTRVAAQTVTGASLPLLSRLVNKSFLHYDRENERYQIHELLRQYAAEKLAQAPDMEAAARDRHSATYCAFLHEHTEQWHTAWQLETLAAVTLESNNVEQAWRWALAQRDWQRLVQAIDSWGWFLDWQGRFADGEAFCQAIVQKAEKQSEEAADSPGCLRLWAKALAWLGFFTADRNVAVDVLQESLALLERPELAEQDTRQEKAFVLYWESSNLLDPNLRRQRIEQSLALYRELDNQWGIALGLWALSLVEWRTGNHDSGLARAQAALIIERERGDRQAQAGCMALLGLIHKTMGQLEEAERLEREALSLSQWIGDRSPLVIRHGNLAYTLLWQGKFGEAQQLAEESLAISRDLGHRVHEGGAQYCLCEALVHSGQYEPAYRQATSGLLVVQATGDRSHEGGLYSVLGQLALVASSYIEAQTAFAKSAEIFQEIQYKIIDLSLAGLGYIACRLGQPQEARQYLAEALVSTLEVKSYIRVVFALPGVALLLAQTSEVARAIEIWALAKCHPFVANSKWFEDVAGRELDDLAASLPPEVAEAAQERGRALDLWQTVAALSVELEAMHIPEQDPIV